MRVLGIILVVVLVCSPVLAEHMVVSVQDRVEVVQGGVVKAGTITLTNNQTQGERVSLSFDDFSTTQVLLDNIGFGVVGMLEEMVHVPGTHSINSNLVEIEYKVSTDDLPLGSYNARIFVEDSHGVREFPVMVDIVRESSGGMVKQSMAFFRENWTFLLTTVGVVSLFVLLIFSVLYWNESRTRQRVGK